MDCKVVCRESNEKFCLFIILALWNLKCVNTLNWGGNTRTELMEIPDKTFDISFYKVVACCISRKEAKTAKKHVIHLTSPQKTFQTSKRIRIVMLIHFSRGLNSKNYICRYFSCEIYIISAPSKIVCRNVGDPHRE